METLMTPTAIAFSWEGFFRSLQGDLLSFAGFLLFVFVASLVIRWAITKGQRDNAFDASQARAVRRWAGRTATALVLIGVVALIWRAALLASINDIPRADVDRSGVYEQMDALTKGPH
jgi:hypothetical protein